MKKLLSILGTVTISAAAISALGLQYGNRVQSSILKRIKNYIDVSSLLARGTILSQDANPETGGRGFSLDYSSRYLDSRNIGDFFPSEASLSGTPKDTKSRILLGSMFNYANNGQVFIPQLSESNLALNPDPTIGKSGNSEIINTFGVISSVLQILLGNDFNEGLAPMIYGLLNSHAITGAAGSIKDSLSDIGKNYLKNPATGDWISDELADVWSEDDVLSANSGKAFTELTFNDVFKVRQDNFWMGLSRILFSGYGADWKLVDEDIKNAATPNEKALVAIPKSGQDFNIAFNGILIEGIFHLIKYLRTLGVFYERILVQAMDYRQIVDRNHLFNPKKSNGVWLSERISATASEAYAPTDNIVANSSGKLPKQAISIWSEEKIDGNIKYYQLINIQSLVQFFTKLFVVDRERDPRSLLTQQALAILLGVPLVEGDVKTKNPNVDNPFGDTILSPTLNALGEYLADRLVISTGFSSSQIDLKFTGLGGLLVQISGFLRAILANGTSMLDPSPLVAESNVRLLIIGLIKISNSDAPISFAKYLVEIISQVKKTIDSISIIPIPENIKQMVNIIYELVLDFGGKIEQEQIDQIPYEEQNFGNPFHGLTDGKFLDSIYDLIDRSGLIAIPAGVRKVIPNLNTLLTTKLGEVLEAFNVAGEDWPIYLYGLRDKTISDVALTIGDRFETNRYKNLTENQKYLFNTRAIERLIKPLSNNEVKIDFKSGTPPEEIKDFFTDNQTNWVFAALVSFAYPNDIQSVTLEGQTTNKAFLSFILGINVSDDDTYSYRDGSLFDALMQLYGHGNEEEPKALRNASKITLQKLINEITSLINWMREKSIPEYVNKFFTPYFVNGWKTKYIASQGVEQPDVPAFIEYDLTNTQNKKSITYRVRLERRAWNPDNNPQPWFDYGIWSLYSINKLN